MSEELIDMGVTDPAAGGESDGQQAVETVPVSVVQAIREELSEVKDRLLVTNAALREARMSGGQQTPQQAPVRQFSGDPLAGMDEDDIPTVSQVRQTLAAKERQFAEAMEVRELINKPDFEAVLKTHWPKVMASKPHLGRMIAGMTQAQAAAFAYEMGQTDPDYQKKKTALPAKGGPTPEEALARKKDKPGSPAQVSAGASSDSEANAIASMSDAEFAAYRKKRLAGSR